MPVVAARLQLFDAGSEEALAAIRKALEKAGVIFVERMAKAQACGSKRKRRSQNSQGLIEVSALGSQK